MSTLGKKYTRAYRQALDDGDQVAAFKAYYALWVLDKKGGVVS